MLKRVEIPKADGSKWKLGIPCVRDRMVQQAIYQVIGGLINPHFSDHSYGFRPNRTSIKLSPRRLNTFLPIGAVCTLPPLDVLWMQNSKNFRFV